MSDAHLPFKETSTRTKSLSRISKSTLFDPAIHLSYQEPESRLSMNDLNLDHVSAPSRIGITSPFPLASLEGVKALRSDILQSSVLESYMTPSAISGSHIQLRGMAPEAAQFIYDFWTSSSVLSAVSQAAGEELVPVFDFELGHTNIQVPSGLCRRDYASSLSVDPFDKTAPAIEEPKKDKKVEPVVGYHRDAYPWVCVLMLSDVSGMMGGETEIKRGDGTKLKAIGPNIGSCVMMQGGYIEHCALPCHGARERITMVTSFRPKGKIVADWSNLKTIRSCSNSFEVYDQYVHSRLDIVQEALEIYRETLKTRRTIIEDAYGRRGGLKRPTVDLTEYGDIAKTIYDTLSNAISQMVPYGSDPDDIYTPELPDTLYSKM